jgi:hypothetical protein
MKCEFEVVGEESLQQRHRLTICSSEFFASSNAIRSTFSALDSPTDFRKSRLRLVFVLPRAMWIAHTFQLTFLKRL